MDISDFVLGCIIAIGCIGSAAFLLGLLFVDVDDAGWRINAPWQRPRLR